MTVSCHTQWQRNACFWQFKLLPMEAMAHLLDKKQVVFVCMLVENSCQRVSETCIAEDVPFNQI
jgi:hypothetical protein